MSPIRQQKLYLYFMLWTYETYCPKLYQSFDLLDGSHCWHLDFLTDKSNCNSIFLPCWVSLVSLLVAFNLMCSEYVYSDMGKLCCANKTSFLIHPRNYDSEIHFLITSTEKGIMCFTICSKTTEYSLLKRLKESH